MPNRKPHPLIVALAKPNRERRAETAPAVPGVAQAANSIIDYYRDKGFKSEACGVPYSLLGFEVLSLWPFAIRFNSSLVSVPARITVEIGSGGWELAPFFQQVLSKEPVDLVNGTTMQLRDLDLSKAEYDRSIDSVRVPFDAKFSWRRMGWSTRHVIVGRKAAKLVWSGLPEQLGRTIPYTEGGGDDEKPKKSFVIAIIWSAAWMFINAGFKKWLFGKKGSAQ